jgi:putative DNA primase/helicase
MNEQKNTPKQVEACSGAEELSDYDNHCNNFYDGTEEGFATIKNQAKDRWHKILEACAPSLTAAIENNGQHVPCPVHGGTDGFRLFPDSDLTGGGVCNTCGNFPDGFKVLSWVNGWNFNETFDAVKAFLHDKQESDEVIFIDSVKEESARKKEYQRAKVEKTMNGAGVDEEIISEYFMSRGLPDYVPPSLLSNESLEYWDKTGPNPECLGNFPAMIAVYKRNDIECGIHCTYIKEDYSGKADVPNPKKSMKTVNDLKGCAIQLFPIEKNKPLVVCEGIETGIAIYEATKFPVWACGTATLLESVEIPDEVLTVYIAADLDKSERGGQAAERLAHRLHSEGKEVHIVTPSGPIIEGEKSVDWLDVLNQEVSSDY